MRIVALGTLALAACATGAASAPDPIPLSEVADGGRGIVRAWLAEATDRYRHGVLGDALEAGALIVEDAQGHAHVFRLPAVEVFEDNRPRLADLDGDGADEVLVVRTHLDRGASLAAFGLRGGDLVQLAQTAYVGQPFHWLNPAGAADFDGDGRIEVALVRTPHIGGVLEFHEFDGDRFIPEFEVPGFSNHALGSPELDLSAVVDANGDGVTDLVVPATGRSVLRVVTAAGGRFAELGRIGLPAPAASEMVVRNGRLAVTLEDGRRAEAALAEMPP